MKMGAKLVCSLALLRAICLAQSATELQELVAPQLLDLSSDGLRLWYKLGQNWWEVDTDRNSRPKRVDNHRSMNMDKPAQVKGTPRLSSPRRSPDRKRTAYLDAQSLMALCCCFVCPANNTRTSTRGPCRGCPFLHSNGRGTPSHCG